MALIVVLVIAVMSIVLGAEQGPKADPTTTTYVPRPEWYFFFLFELLRVLRPSYLVPIATIGIPTLCMVLLLLLPFYDRGPERRPERRPVAMTAMVMTIIAMAFLTYEGANTGSTNEVQLAIAGVQGGTSQTAADRAAAAARCAQPDLEPAEGHAGARQRPPDRGAERLPRLPQDRRQRQPRPGADAHPDRRPDPARLDPALAEGGPGDHAVVHDPAAGEAEAARRLPGVAASSASTAAMTAAGTRPQPEADRVRLPGEPDVRPDRRGLRPHEQHDDRRARPALARAHGRAARRRGPGATGARRLLRHRRPGDRAGPPRGRRRQRDRLRLLGADARPRPREGHAAAPAPRALRVGRRAAAALRRRQLRRGHGGVRSSELRRSRPRPRRARPRPASRRAARDPRDHAASAPAPVLVLRAVVRPRSCRSWARLAGRSRRVQLPARVGQALPASRGPRGAHGRERPGGRPLPGPRRRDHRDPSRGSDRREPLGGSAARNPGPRRRRRLAAARAWRPSRTGCARAVAAGGTALDADATATLEAGGKRLRPMLVLLCAGPGAGEPAIHAAAAVELVHMATLVHDDVLDDAPAATGAPDGAGDLAAATARLRSGTCSSPARSPSSPGPAARTGRSGGSSC